jgi:hypothetical protein
MGLNKVNIRLIKDIIIYLILLLIPLLVFLSLPDIESVEELNKSWTLIAFVLLFFYLHLGSEWTFILLFSISLLLVFLNIRKNSKLNGK